MWKDKTMPPAIKRAVLNFFNNSTPNINQLLLRSNIVLYSDEDIPFYTETSRCLIRPRIFDFEQLFEDALYKSAMKSAIIRCTKFVCMAMN